MLVVTLHYQDQEEQGQKQNEGGECALPFLLSILFCDRRGRVGRIILTIRAVALKALDARVATSATPPPGPASSASGPSTSPTTATVPIPPTLNKAASSKGVPQVEDKIEKVKD